MMAEGIVYSVLKYPERDGIALILNAVVNLTFQCPAVSTSYVLHAVYIYNASLLCSRGSSEYIF
jgi:hypothetical protein